MSANEAFFASRSMQALEVLAFGPCDRDPAGRRSCRSTRARPGGCSTAWSPTAGWSAARARGRRTRRRCGSSPSPRSWRTGHHSSSTPTEVARDLHDRTGNPVHLAIPSYRSALRLIRANGRDDGVRDLAPAHAIAAGKLLLAFREPWREVVLASPLASVTDRTLVDAGVLRAELEASRDRGYAVEDEEFRSGGRALAVPVRAGGRRRRGARRLVRDARRSTSWSRVPSGWRWRPRS